jgi:hypothetical protein
MIKKTLVIVLIVLGNYSYSQQVHTPINHEVNSVIEKNLYRIESDFHTSVRPFYHHEVQQVYNLDSVENTLKDKNRIYLLGNSWWAKSILWSEKKLLNDNFIKTSKGVVDIRVNPIFHLSRGTERINQDKTWQNTRGFWLEGNIGKKFSFNSSFYESQGLFLPYQNAYMDQTYIVPGQGRSKAFKDGPAVDWGFAIGSIVYKANKIFTFQFGHDKNFLGDGYRSLLLSDNSTTYPFLKIETTFWKIKYVNIYAQLNHYGFDGSADRLFDQKYFSAQYLSWNIIKRWNFSLFEVVNWRALPGRNLDANYINPIIFLRPVEYQNGSKDGVLIGATTKFKINNKISLYGQLVIDDLKIAEFKNGTNWWGNKYAIQGGIKMFDVFTLPGLSMQVEYNTARPYTYSHSDSVNAYAHLNQALAHPLGANFNELVGFLRYNYKRHFVQIRYSQAVFGLDTANINHGQNIFYSYNTNKVDIEGEDGDFGHKTLQGLKTTLTIIDAKYSFLINPSSNLFFDLGLTNRQYVNDLTNVKTNYIYFGVRTSLSNFYNDFL